MPVSWRWELALFAAVVVAGAVAVYLYGVAA